MLAWWTVMGALAAEPPSGGIGALLQGDSYDGHPVVIQVFATSPAAAAGLLPGDVIVRVDAWETRGESTATIVAHIAGPQGTPVTLEVRRDGAPMTLTPTRAATAPLIAAHEAHVAATCGPLKQGYVDRKNKFATVKGAPTTGPRTDTAYFAVTTPDPSATYTRIEVSDEVLWAAGFPGSPKVDVSAAALDALVARYTPCLPGHWIAPETVYGSKMVYFGMEHAMGRYSATGAFRTRGDGSLDLVLYTGPIRYLRPLTGAPTGAWAEPLRAITDAAPKRFDSVRGRQIVEHTLYASSSSYAATVPLPGASDCRVYPAGDSPDGPWFQCDLTDDAPPEQVASAYDEARAAIAAALGDGWVSWDDDELVAPDRYFVHYAKRASRGPERTAVVTLGLTDGRVTLRVQQRAVP